MRIAIVTYAPFPLGLATTNRVYYYAKGLIDQGMEAKVFIITSTEEKENIKNKSKKGVYNGIPFEYTSVSTVRDKSLIKRKFDDVFGINNTGYKIIKENYDHVILLSTNSSTQTMYFKYFCMLFGLKFLEPVIY